MYHSEESVKQALRQMIAAYQANPLPSIKARDIDLTSFIDTKVKKIVTVTGFRRVGKTYILLDFVNKHGKEKCLYLNLEDERLPEKTEVLTLLEEILREEYPKQTFVLLMDEIQRIPLWSEWARRVNETTLHRLIISGSSSKLSSQELPTELRGHALTIPVSPLSLGEFLRFKDISPEHVLLGVKSILLAEYLHHGGLPEIVLSEAGVKPLLISDYLTTFVARDIIDRYHLRSRDAFEALLRLLLTTRNYTYSKLAHSLQSMGYQTIVTATVIRYMRWMSSSLFLKNLSVFTPNIKKEMQAVKKSYLVDTYFAAHATQAFSENTGMLMEQAVFLELLKRNAMHNRDSFFYWKDFFGHEVDFVVREGQRTKELIQVTYASAISEIHERETSALIKASTELGCDTLTLITWQFSQAIQKDNKQIRCVPLYDWLLKS